MEDNKAALTEHKVDTLQQQTTIEVAMESQCLEQRRL
jgi:hypothetical protein